VVGVYGDQVLPRALDLLMRGADVREVRARVNAGMSGVVLEIGFGSGLNVPHYPAGVTRVLAVDPAMVGRRLAATRIAAHAVAVEFTGTDAQALPVAGASADFVLSTWTLCTIPDPARALAEAYRVLRPGGELHFVEHGLSPEARVARMQHGLTPLHRRAVGGCRLDRPIADLITEAGFRLTRLENYYFHRPRAVGYTYEGAAIKPEAA
jgi:ubiquinone/menaquinone biosynthesis C-methylase UbiE